MAIQGLGQYGGFYNNFKTNSIPAADADIVKVQDEQAIEAEKNLQGRQNDSAALSTTGIEEKRSRVARLEDVSLTFNTGDTFDYIGNDSEIRNLDLQKAVSDMKKDQILEEYQYFYGSSNNISQSEDGLVMQKIYF